MRKWIALALAALLLLGSIASAEEVKTAPPTLSLLNGDQAAYIAVSGSYSWEYPTGKADEWNCVEACGAGPTDPTVFANAEHLLLEGVTAFTLDFQNDDPETLHAFAWNNAVFGDPENRDSYQYAVEDALNRTDGRLSLTMEPGRVYLLQAKWPENQHGFGNADYYIVTDGVMSTMDEADEADWILPESIEMTTEVTDLFNAAMDGLVGVRYEPLGYLGEKEGVYCVLCRGTVVYPGAKPFYALVYVTKDGVQNIWEIWMDKHAK